MSGATDEPHFQRPEGWALKTIKRAQRIQGRVKIYLTEKFNEGMRTDNKADPAQVAHEMRHEKDSSQNLEFLPSALRVAFLDTCGQFLWAFVFTSKAH